MREKAVPAPKPIAPAVKPQIIPQPEQKVVNVPIGQLKTTNVSIKSILTKKDDPQSISERHPEQLPREAFTFDQVKMMWRRYAFEMKEKSMETYYNAMIKREPVMLADTRYRMDVDNQVQINLITPHLQDMVQYFRKELKNYDFSIELKITEQEEEEVKYLNGKDKFAALARKNPNLHTLKNMFNLDIEF